MGVESRDDDTYIHMGYLQKTFEMTELLELAGDSQWGVQNSGDETYVHIIMQHMPDAEGCGVGVGGGGGGSPGEVIPHPEPQGDH